MLSFIQENHYDKLTSSFIQRNTLYEVKERIGEGSYGVAYLLIHRETGEKAVLKRLKARHFKKSGVQKFVQEIDFLKQLHDLPVPKILQEGWIYKAPFYIMTFMEGHTFEQAIFQHGHQYSNLQTVEKTIQLLELVTVFHERQIVHRDLRIPNIFIHENALSIIDFGLATKLEPSSELELTKNPKKAKSAHSDLYAIGHFMLFLLYSQFEPTSRKKQSWQQELALPHVVQHFIERLLLIEKPFATSAEALHQLIDIKQTLLTNSQTVTTPLAK